MSNEKEFMVQKIRIQYMEKEFTDLDALKELDKKAKRPANIFTYTFGTISALITGCGMSLIMTDLGTTLNLANPLVPGIILGIIGLALCLVNYPIYKKILESSKSKYKDEIFRLADKIAN